MQPYTRERLETLLERERLSAADAEALLAEMAQAASEIEMELTHGEAEGGPEIEGGTGA